MATVLKVKADGAWRTVVEPYVNVDGTWKTVHNIWVKHGGTWRLTHKTGFDRYSLLTDNSLISLSNSGTYTVATGVRYLKVHLTGGGGQGGGNVRSGGAGLEGGHLQCSGGSYSGYPTVTDYAYGAQGGHPGFINVTFEVIPGETYTWSGGVGGSSGGGNESPMELNYHTNLGSAVSVGTAKSGGTGGTGTALTFTGPSATLSAGGGIGGTGGTVTVSANCIAEAGTIGYTVGVTNPNQPGHNSNSISATNLISTTTNGAANTGGGAGASGFSAGTQATNGSSGGVSIFQYKA